jgi:predicted phage-related endonuclease
VARDAAIANLGIGGSDIAALVGLDPRRDAFDVYAEKMGLVEPQPPTTRMRAGTYLEAGILRWYGEETQQELVLDNVTRQHPERPWQVYTCDAFALSDAVAMPHWAGVVDAKLVSLDQLNRWGEPGTDVVPDHIALQAQWYCSATKLPWCDIAALIGGNDLRIYRLHFDAEVEVALLTRAQDFWERHLVPGVAPIIGSTNTAKTYLQQRFPRNTEAVRVATAEEVTLMGYLREAKAEADRAIARKVAIENQIKAAIGDAEGLVDDALGKIAWKLTKDTEGVDWEKAFRGLWEAVEDNGDFWFPDGKPSPTMAEYTKPFVGVLRRGPRKLLTPRTWPKLLEGGQDGE